MYDRGLFLGGGMDFSLHHNVQTDSGKQPASYPEGTGFSFPAVGLKRLEREADHLHIEPKLRMRKLYLLFSMRLCGVVFD